MTFLSSKYARAIRYCLAGTRTVGRYKVVWNTTAPQVSVIMVRFEGLCCFLVCVSGLEPIHQKIQAWTLPVILLYSQTDKPLTEVTGDKVMDMAPNLLDLIDEGYSVRDDHLGPCVGDDDTTDGEIIHYGFDLGPCVGDDVDPQA